MTSQTPRSVQMVPMTGQEIADAIDALACQANIIETGNPAMSAQDAEAMGKKFKALDLDQMTKVVRLRQLRHNLLNMI